VAALALAAVFAVAAVAGCSEEEAASFSKQRIVKAVGLEEAEDGYTIGGDPFCLVDRRLLNDAEEVAAARDSDELGLTVASAAGNVGIRAKPPFAPDCRRQAKTRLNRLDSERRK
jgi:hypothetical protein